MFIMGEKYNLEKCVLDDCKRTWKENDFDNVNFNLVKSSCNCIDKLTILLHLNVGNNTNLISYKEAKIVQMFSLLLKNGAQNCLLCGHQWYSYNCQEYVKNVRQLLENVVL